MGKSSSKSSTLSHQTRSRSQQEPQQEPDSGSSGDAQKYKRSYKDKHGKKSKRRRRDRADGTRVLSLLGDAEKMVSKLQRWACRGKAEKLDDLLTAVGPSGAKPLMAVKDLSGRSLLHQACLAGHGDVVGIFLRHGADARATDIAGNTPAHTAALSACAGQLLIITQILNSERPPDIDATNNRGLSISMLVDGLLGGGTGPKALGPGQAGQAAAQAHNDSGIESEGAAWRRRLAEEGGYDDQEAGYSYRGAQDDNRYSIKEDLEEEAGADDDDAWADRIWAEMQARRRAAALASSQSFATSMAEARLQQEVEQAAAKAAAAARLKESEKVLRQEQARDRAWRERAGGDVPRLEGPAEGPAVPQPLGDPLAAQQAYEARWMRMEASLGSGKEIRAAEVAWPLPAGCAYTVDNLRELLLGNAEGPADIRKRLRTELMRWHPDKFASRTAGRLRAEEVLVVGQRVKEISQALTQLLSS